MTVAYQFFDTVKQHRPGSAPVTYCRYEITAEELEQFLSEHPDLRGASKTRWELEREKRARGQSRRRSQRTEERRQKVQRDREENEAEAQRRDELYTNGQRGELGTLQLA
eukprot:gene23574-49563_t